MNIKGDKVYFRAIEETDADILLQLMNDPETEFMLGGYSFPISMTNQNEWIKNLEARTEILRCMIVSCEDQKAIGTVILSDIDYKNGIAQIHIKMIQKARGKGYGKATIQLIKKYAFEELRLHLLYATVNEYNKASRNLFEGEGFQLEGILKSRIYKQGKCHNVCSYSISKE